MHLFSLSIDFVNQGPRLGCRLCLECEYGDLPSGDSRDHGWRRRLERAKLGGEQRGAATDCVRLRRPRTTAGRWAGAAKAKASFLATSDGGMTWSVTTSLGLPRCLTGWASFTVHFVDQNHGWAVGNDCAMVGASTRRCAALSTNEIWKLPPRISLG